MTPLINDKSTLSFLFEDAICLWQQRVALVRMKSVSPWEKTREIAITCASLVSKSRANRWRVGSDPPFAPQHPLRSRGS
ncbi:MAG: hypothetical protein PUP93_18825 [Rhizonema sp. NSF051]|nr:hypothetical protein [Rhizonema sp. NSF051]